MTRTRELRVLSHLERRRLKHVKQLSQMLLSDISYLKLDSPFLSRDAKNKKLVGFNSSTIIASAF
jgi:hypothetical protein